MRYTLFGLFISTLLSICGCAEVDDSTLSEGGVDKLGFDAGVPLGGASPWMEPVEPEPVEPEPVEPEPVEPEPVEPELVEPEPVEPEPVEPEPVEPEPVEPEPVEPEPVEPEPVEPEPVEPVLCSVNGTSGECLNISVCEGTSVPGYCPGPAEIQCCLTDLEPPDSGEQCLESPSWEQMPRPNEGLSEELGGVGCPFGMARVDDYCVDRFEASLVERLADGSERSWSPFFNPGQRDVYAVSLRFGVPQGYISGAQAQRACQAAGKRLCTDVEWRRACSGPSSFTFPYGDTRVWGQCNDHRDTHPAVSYFNSSADHIWSMLSNPCINQQANSLTSNDLHAACVSEEGVWHMVGGLHEWTSDPQGTFRGGFYADTTRNGEGCAYRTTAHSFSYSDYSTGFRCCADAD